MKMYTLIMWIYNCCHKKCIVIRDLGKNCWSQMPNSKGYSLAPLPARYSNCPLRAMACSSLYMVNTMMRLSTGDSNT